MEEFVVEDYSSGPPEEPSGEKCPRCREPIALNAERCPRCGQPVNTVRSTLPFLAGLVLVLGLLLAGVILYRTAYTANLEKAVPVRTDADSPPDFGFGPDTSAEHDLEAARGKTAPQQRSVPKPEQKPLLNR